MWASKTMLAGAFRGRAASMSWAPRVRALSSLAPPPPPPPPKRPASPYILFGVETRGSIKGSPREVVSELGKKWKALTPGDKKKYEDVYDKSKAAYAVEKEAFVKKYGEKALLSDKEQKMKSRKAEVGAKIDTVLAKVTHKHETQVAKLKAKIEKLEDKVAKTAMKKMAASRAPAKATKAAPAAKPKAAKPKAAKPKEKE